MAISRESVKASWEKHQYQVWEQTKLVMLPTPTTRSVDYGLVYEPAEDSFLLLDLLEEDKPFLDARFAGQSPVVVELGTGSGIVTTFVHNSIVPNGLFLTTDVNIHACRAVVATSAENGGTKYLESMRASLTTALRPKLIDVLIFNPPYVPNEAVPQQPAGDDDPQWLDLALEGGEDGMEVTNIVLDSLDSILSEQGAAYILFCKRNKPEQVAERIRETGWTVHRIGERKAGWEVLSVWRFTR